MENLKETVLNDNKNYNKMEDKNGIEIKLNDDVIAYNEETDTEFLATVENFRRGKYVIVIDQDGDYLCIEP